ncbi:MAG TPA: hypothetical protein VK203_29105 [Nostocaceae cyanobacterium]|nr:hypothetical protein [Nostocaceae cyanobacterium]
MNQDSNIDIKIKSFLLNSSNLVHEKVVNPSEASQNRDVIEAVNLVQKEFKDVLPYIDWLLKKADSNLWYSFSDDWSIQYGGQFLIEHSPQYFLEVISNLYANLKENENSINWVNVSIFCSLLKKLLQELTYINLGYKENSQLLDLLPDSHIPLIRAIVTQSLWISLKWKINNLEFVLSIVSKLTSLEEQIYSLAEWVHNLRIKAKQINYQEQTDEEILLKQIFAKICQLWKSDFSQILLNVLFRLSGVTIGEWAISNHNEFLLPLLQAEKINFDNILELWFKILLDYRLKNEPNQEKLSNRLSYPQDLELIKVCSYSLTNTTPVNRNKYYEEITKIFNPCRRILLKPFSRSQNSDAWFNAFVLLLWLGIFYKFCLKNGNLEADDKFLNQLQEKIQDIDTLIIPSDISLDIKDYYLDLLL